MGAAALGGLAARDLTQKKHALLRNFPVIGQPALPAGERSVRSCGSTSSPTTTRSGRSAATSAGGSTRRPSWRTTTSASAPTTTSRILTATRSSSTGRSRRGCAATAVHTEEEMAVPVGQGARGLAWPGAGLPAGLGRQHLRDELRVAVRNGDRGAQQGRPARRLPAQHRRGRGYRRTTARAATSSGRSAPPTSAAATSTAGSTSAGSRTSWPQSAPVRAIEIKLSAKAPSPASAAAAGGQGHCRDRRDPRHRLGAGLCAPEPSLGLQRRRHDARLRRDARRRETGLPVGIKSAVGNLDVLGRAHRRDGRRATERSTSSTIDGGEGGTGAAPLIFARLGRAARSGSASRRVYRMLRRGGPGRRRHVHRRRQARPPGQRHRRLRPRLRHGQRRP